jgi:branched-chain amino acid transport system permease protein
MTGLVRRYGVWIAFAAVMALLPTGITSSFAMSIASQIGVAMVFALAYNMLLGQGGMLSFGHAIFFGLSGYFTVHYINLIGEEAVPYFPISLVPLFGGIAGLFFGILVGYVSTRRAGTVFAMISLGFAEMVTALTLILSAFFHGEEGVQTDRWVGPEPFGITFGPDIQVYYLIAVWTFVSVIAMYFLTRTPFGRMSNAVRDNPERVEFIGYNTQRVRWLAFSLSSFFAGIAGALHALLFEHVGFETVSLQQSGLVLYTTYIGGIGHFVGPILGAVLITILNGMLSNLTEAWFLYLGVMFVAVVMFAPGGLAGLVMMHEPVWKADPRLMKRLVPSYAASLASTAIAAFGIVGLVEIIYFHSTALETTQGMTLFTVPVDPASAIPWLLCGATAVVGIAACRMSYPVARRAWDRVVLEARSRMMR